MRLRHPIPGAPWGAAFGWRGAIAGLPAGLHNGQDFPAGTGTRVYAAADGVAYRRWEGGGFGNYIYMTHGSGRETFYAHLNGFAVANGTRVKAGQLIGYVGSTGASTGPHLHFSYRKNGAWINPRPLIYTPSSGGGATNTTSADDEGEFSMFIRRNNQAKVYAYNPLTKRKRAIGTGEWTDIKKAIAAGGGKIPIVNVPSSRYKHYGI